MFLIENTKGVRMKNTFNKIYKKESPESLLRTHCTDESPNDFGKNH